MIRFHNNHNGSKPNGEFSPRLAESLLRAIKEKQGALISAARKTWERRFAGRDPADSCVSVRINGDKPLPARSKAVPLEVQQAREPSATNSF